jgi:hypothetical protein
MERAAVSARLLRILELCAHLKDPRVVMPAYLLLLLAVLSRVVPHPDWLNFTAVGGALLYFGARRPWREMLAPFAVLMATDVYLTLFSYHYTFQWQDYVPTWTWYIAAMALGQILLRSRTTLPRFVSAVLLGPTSFFLMSNFAVWMASAHSPAIASDMYAKTWAGLVTCYAAGLPFYSKDLVSTTIVAGLAFGVPVLIRRIQQNRVAAAAVR